MWKAVIEGRTLTFHLAGINNQNFLMQDDVTHSWWQQVSGECVVGPMRGRALALVPYDELTFATWKREHPDGRVLRVNEDCTKEDWEARVEKLPVVTPKRDQDAFVPRAIIVGITLGQEAKAYALDTIKQHRLLVDAVGGVPVMLVLADDGKSVRAFSRMLDGEALEFFAKPDSASLALVDARSASEWDFTGMAIAGPMQGRQLERVTTLIDFWFDWQVYHPGTRAYPR